ncbi:autophagy-related protein 28 [Phlyctema vagabunda]|uniref:Autophagy-related protein 28 n=1 Tax=Phlyctema vagabunda TaxID=108571 RepID=A0ABR4P5E9_9HELO
MSRASSFFTRHSANDQSSEALLHDEYSDSHSLEDLSPRPSVDLHASASPPASFYRAQNHRDAVGSPSPARTPRISTGLSPERTPFQQPRKTKIQFAAPPPPIAKSVMLVPAKDATQSRRPGGEGAMAGSILSSGRRGSRTRGVIDPLLGLQRREKALQNELQELLDAQSVGLIQGFGGAPDRSSLDGGSEAGSSTPTSRSVMRDGSANREKIKGVTPVRQPQKKTVGLRGARRGILRDIGELVAVKMEEGAILDQEISKREQALEKVSVWEGLIAGFGSKLQGEANDGEDTRQIEELRNEERAVDNEMREMEDRLLQMRARKQWLRGRISEKVNRKEARLSSYRGALRDAELEVKEFLKRPPVDVSPAVLETEEESFMALPPNRRTLGMAREWWNKEISGLRTRKSSVGKEQLALEEGAQLWQDSARAVMEFEDDLRAQMAKGAGSDGSLLRQQVDKMAAVIQKLEEGLKTAEDKRWNLLICAVGAEVAAFKEGEMILRGALGMLDPGWQEENGTEGHGENGHADDETENEVPASLLSPEPNHGPASPRLELRKIESIEREVMDSEGDDDDGPDLATLMVG